MTSNEPTSDFYRSLRAVKVLLAALRSTLTVLAPQMGGTYRFALETSALLLNNQLRLRITPRSHLRPASSLAFAAHG